MDGEVKGTSPLGADEPLLAACVGVNWESYYRPRFEALAAGGPAWMWNHAAALVPFWMSFRRLSVALVVHSVQIVAVVITMNATGAMWLGLLLPFAVTGAVQGGLGTHQVWRSARRAVAKARRRHGDDTAAAVADLARGAPRLTPGARATHLLGSAGMLFLFAVIVVSFAPHSHDHDRAYRAVLKSDLRNLLTYQEAFYADSGRFTATLDNMSYSATTGVTVTVTDVSAEGFRATATHEHLPRWVCVIELSSAPDSGTPVCRSAE